jgi:16S rRNA (adenine1518-N6/adenine1519-N6)-dimethyltransferase
MIIPKKNIAQHFLVDNNIANKIVNCLSFNGYSNIVEVGPGMGILTNYLVYKSENLFLIEIDDRLIDYLKCIFPFLGLKIIKENFLNWNPTQFSLDNFALIGNFPYNISSQILFRLLLIRNNIPECIGMFQKEVADRIASSHGNKKYGMLSVLTQAFYTVKYLFTVNENVFNPKPNIKSAVVRFIRKNEILNFNYNIFFNFVKLSFITRRKTIRNSIKKLSLPDIVYQSSLLDRRVEHLSVEEFINICKLIST